MLGIRGRVLLALVLVALVTPLVLLATHGWIFGGLRTALDRAETERVAAALDLEIRRLGDLAARTSDWANRVAAAAERTGDQAPQLELLREPDPGWVQRRRLRRTREALAVTAERARLERWVVLDPAGAPCAGEAGAPRPPLDPATLASLPEGLPVWSWDPGRERLWQIAVAGWPRGAGPEGRRLAFVALAEHPPAQLAGRIGAALDAEVVVEPRRPGRRPPAPGGGIALATLPGVASAPAAYLLAEPAVGARTLTQGVRRSVALAAAAGLAAAVLLALLLGPWLTRPLERLTAAVARITGGEEAPTPLPEGPGEVGRLALAIDGMLVTIRREQVRRLAAERQAAWQEVARRVAHEVKNPLTPIRLAVDNLRRTARRRPEALAPALEEEAAAILHEVGRLERLVREFTEFARLPVPRPEPVDLPALVHASLTAQAGPGEAVAVEVEAAEDLPPVAADPDLLGAALENIARNAVEAMGAEGGRLAATIRRLDATGPPRVEVLVADTGPGVPEELRERLLEPYVTGRGPAGTGLGLAIAARVVREHGGVLELADTGAGGACFRIVLPAGSEAGRA
jgi:signal transduction histidine kinase